MHRLSKYLKQDKLDVLYEMIESLPLESIDAVAMNLVRKFTDEAMYIVGSKAARAYGFDLFWKWMQDDSGLELALSNAARLQIVELLKLDHLHVSLEDHHLLYHHHHHHH